MGKKKKEKTNALRLLDQKKISYEEHSYSWSEDHLSAGSVADELALPSDQIFKTLVAVGNKSGPLVAVIPGNAEVDLKKLAKVSQNKKVEMLHLKDLETTTGYLRGGCSPVGMKKLFPTYIDASAQTFQQIIVSAGKRGLQMALDPKDLVQVVNGVFAEITALEKNEV